MLFNSYIFILVFLPICMIGYFGLNHFRKYTLAQAFLLGMSLWFYGYFNPGYLLIITVSIVANYLFTRLMGKTADPRLRKAELILALLANLGVLFYYKYYDFFITSVNQIAGTDFTLRHVLLPLGISFFTFQQLSYVIDAYRGQVQQYKFLQYASFVAYFPQLIAGPIVTHDELIPQFMDESKKKFNWDNFARGMFMFVLGLAKKVLIADVFGEAANWGFGNVASLDTTNAILASLAYTFQIYFDFSGYCDMAIGIGEMMNLELPVNFDSPYKALTITAFWSRWHKTLTRFFTRYIYIPLGGNRKGKVRTYLNIMIVFLASGLWHGAGWAFILWGFLHGAFNVVTRKWRPWFEKLHPALSWLMTFVFLNLTWILFRTESIPDSMVFLKKLLVPEFAPVSQEILDAFLLPELKLVLGHLPVLNRLVIYPSMLMLLFYGGALALVLGPRNAREHMLHYRPTVLNLLTTWVLLVWCILSFSGVSTFLYFNF
ncbi:MAG: MBOAT family O-acyltransferase [Eubacteriales bacterium]|nr:MBOAT family O-acyltransferase [Eubacteriales bacterium]